MTPQCIVIPVALQRYVDPPPVAERQRDLARLLAAAAGSKMCFVSVEAPSQLVPQLETVEEKLRTFTAPLVAHGFDVERAVLKGRPRDVLPPYVLEKEADLVIMGSHSKRSPLDLVMGNTANALLDALPHVEVVMVRPTIEEAAAAAELMIPDYPYVFTYV